MAEIDPLKILGLASQFQPDISGDKALRDLQTKGAITGMQQRGATTRSTASNLSDYARTLAGLGMTPETAGVGLPQLQKDLQFKRIAPAAALAQKGGLHFKLPTDQPTTIGQLPDVSLRKGPMSAEAAAIAEARVKSKEGIGEKRTSVEYNPKTGELEGVVRSTESSQEGQLKGSGSGVTKNAKAIQASVAAKLKAMGRAFKSIEVVREEADGVVVRIDGKEITIPYDD